MDRRKIILTLAVFVLLCALGVGAIWRASHTGDNKIAANALTDRIYAVNMPATNAQVPKIIQGWKTYVNSRYAYSFQYDPTWGIDSSKGSANYYSDDIHVTRPDRYDAGYVKGFYELTIQPVSGTCEIGWCGQDWYTRTMGTLDNEKAEYRTRIFNNNGRNLSQTHIYFKWQDTVLEISYDVPEDPATKTYHDESVKNLLATFLFKR